MNYLGALLLVLLLLGLETLLVPDELLLHQQIVLGKKCDEMIKRLRIRIELLCLVAVID